MYLFVNDLTVIDFSYLCPIRGMVGESWIVDVRLNGTLDAQNMVLDFAKVKKIIKQTIDTYVDHRLLVPTLSANVEMSQFGHTTQIDFVSAKGTIQLGCPKQAFAFIHADTIDYDSVEQFLLQVLQDALPDNVKQIELILRNEKLNGAYYHYSHGLKKHDGNCQRIAHGHRSPIAIYCNDKLMEDICVSWSQRWQNIYLANKDDLCLISNLQIKIADAVTEQSHYGFSYHAPQGQFQLIMPKAICDIIPHDTTVELLAQFILDNVATPNQHWRVMAFEGVGKGAIVTNG